MIFTKPVTIKEVSDLEVLFEGRGGPHYCWCTLWRKDVGRKLQDKTAKKTCLLSAIRDGIQVGMLMYEDDAPIAWCSVGPRETFRNLGGDEDLSDVWSIVCFYIKRSHRRMGIASMILDQAIIMARQNGAKYLEAYAAAANTTSYRFMGFVPMYERAGFAYIKMAGKRRHVMLKPLW